MVIPSNLIINADDFGENFTKNSAISKCFSLGIINSTSLMTNMESFQEAIKMSKENGFQEKIGLHVNLSHGKPLTNLSKTRLIDQNGFFKKNSVNKKFFYLSSLEKILVKREIEAQLSALYLNNIKPTHINSHYHVHTLPWLVTSFLEVAKKFNIKIRIAQTWNNSPNILVPIYRNILNSIYKKNKLNFTARFETIDSYNSSISKINKAVSLTEIMVHPDLNSNNEIYDSYNGCVLEKELRRIL